MAANDGGSAVCPQLPDHHLHTIGPQDDIVVGENDLIACSGRSRQNSVPPCRAALVRRRPDHFYSVQRTVVRRVEGTAIIDHHNSIGHHRASQNRLDQPGQQAILSKDGNTEQERHGVLVDENKILLLECRRWRPIHLNAFRERS